MLISRETPSPQKRDRFYPDLQKRFNPGGKGFKRESFAQIPPRVEYSLTKEGAKLRDAVMPLINGFLLGMLSNI
jgi:hypothetical protein